MALMKEIETIKGHIDINGSIFYVSQEPWIFNSTLKQNILFGKSYDEQKFEEVLKACSLDKVNSFLHTVFSIILPKRYLKTCFIFLGFDVIS